MLRRTTNSTTARRRSLMMGQAAAADTATAAAPAAGSGTSSPVHGGSSASLLDGKPLGGSFLLGRDLGRGGADGLGSSRELALLEAGRRRASHARGPRTTSKSKSKGGARQRYSVLGTVKERHGLGKGRRDVGPLAGRRGSSVVKSAATGAVLPLVTRDPADVFGEALWRACHGDHDSDNDDSAAAEGAEATVTSGAAPDRDSQSATFAATAIDSAVTGAGTPRRRGSTGSHSPGGGLRHGHSSAAHPQPSPGRDSASLVKGHWQSRFVPDSHKVEAVLALAHATGGDKLQALAIAWCAPAELSRRQSSPVHEAAFRRGGEAALLLLLRASRNAVDVLARGQMTPLHYCAVADRAPAARLLLAAGAMVSIQDKRRLTALQLAKHCGATAVAEVIERHEWRPYTPHGALIKGPLTHFRYAQAGAARGGSDDNRGTPAVAAQSRVRGRRVSALVGVEGLRALAAAPPLLQWNDSHDRGADLPLPGAAAPADGGLADGLGFQSAGPRLAYGALTGPATGLEPTMGRAPTDAALPPTALPANSGTSQPDSFALSMAVQVAPGPVTRARRRPEDHPKAPFKLSPREAVEVAALRSRIAARVAAGPGGSSLQRAAAAANAETRAMQRLTRGGTRGRGGHGRRSRSRRGQAAAQAHDSDDSEYPRRLSNTGSSSSGSDFSSSGDSAGLSDGYNDIGTGSGEARVPVRGARDPRTQRHASRRRHGDSNAGKARTRHHRRHRSSRRRHGHTHAHDHRDDGDALAPRGRTHHSLHAFVARDLGLHGAVAARVARSLRVDAQLPSVAALARVQARHVPVLVAVVAEAAGLNRYLASLLDAAVRRECGAVAVAVHPGSSHGVHATARIGEHPTDATGTSTGGEGAWIRGGGGDSYRPRYHAPSPAHAPPEAPYHDVRVPVPGPPVLDYAHAHRTGAASLNMSALHDGRPAMPMPVPVPMPAHLPLPLAESVPLPVPEHASVPAASRAPQALAAPVASPVRAGSTTAVNASYSGRHESQRVRALSPVAAVTPQPALPPVPPAGPHWATGTGPASDTYSPHIDPYIDSSATTAYSAGVVDAAVTGPGEVLSAHSHRDGPAVPAPPSGPHSHVHRFSHRRVYGSRAAGFEVPVPVLLSFGKDTSLRLLDANSANAGSQSHTHGVGDIIMDPDAPVARRPVNVRRVRRWRPAVAAAGK